MKRTLIFNFDECYKLFDKDDEQRVVEIDENALQLSSKKLYEIFFKELNEEPNYEIKNEISTEKFDADFLKKSKFIYETVQEIVTKVCQKLSEDKVFQCIEQETEQNKDDDLPF